MSDPTAIATVGFHEALTFMSHLLRLALRSPPLHNCQPRCSVPPTPVRYKGDAVARIFFLADQVAELGLLAAFPPTAPFFDLVVLSPFPASRELLLQVCVLLVAEECIRLWAYKVAANWMSKQDVSPEGDMASVLAVEYLIPKATLPLIMLMLGVSRALWARQPVIHLAVFVCWIAVRQFRMFERGLDLIPYHPSIEHWLKMLNFRSERKNLATAPVML